MANMEKEILLEKEIQRDAHSSCFQNVMKLLEHKLHQNRARLDDAVGDDVLRLQGANRTLKELLRLKDPVLTIKHQDGAYD